ncbi:MAG: hypothetical protein HRU26_17195 [Psychroserpens sp.]|nr:hypothetical protein [Psychroserpens sp.]
MKKVLTILALVLLPVLSYGQNANAETKKNDSVETVIIKETKTQNIKTSTAATSSKAQVIKINRKKSNEIISIKSFRKSLHIKVKEVVTC